MLEDKARGVTTGAYRAHDAFHALVLVGILRQGRQHDIAGQLPHVVLQRLEHEILFAYRG